MIERLNQDQVDIDDQAVRGDFAESVIALSQQYYQVVCVDSPAPLPVVGDSLLRNIPIMDFVTDGDLTVTRSPAKAKIKGEISARIDSLPIEEVQSGQAGLNDVIAYSGTQLPFKTIQRLKSYLPVMLPDTREGVRVLREISSRMAKQTGQEGRSEKLTENLKSLEQALGVLEDEFASRIVEDQQAVERIFDVARSEARIQLSEGDQRGDEEWMCGLREEVTQRKLSRLRETKVIEIVDGDEREFSQLDIELDHMIEEGNLVARVTEAQEQQGRTVEQCKADATETIIKNRVAKRVAGLMLTDATLRLAAAKIGSIAEQETLSLKGEEGTNARLRIARQLLEMPDRKLARLGFKTFPRQWGIDREERQKLSQAIDLGDPFLFVAQLDEGEFETIRTRVPRLFKRRMSAENRALFALSKEEFKRKLTSEATEDELIELLAEKLFRTLLRRLSQEVIDQAVRSLCINPQDLIDDPLILFNIAEDIIAVAQANEGAWSLPSTKEEESDKDQPSALQELPQFKPVSIPFQRSEALARAMETSIVAPQPERLGDAVLRRDIESTEGPFRYFPEYTIQYPEVITQALAELYGEYNAAFAPLVEANREWATDYQYCMTGPGGSPVNYFVQVDMVGLPDGYLRAASALGVSQVREDLRARIFEIENSLAGYQLLSRIFSRDGQPSNFDRNFRVSLDLLRRKFGKPVALLAVTDEKYQEMRGSEFGKKDGELLVDEEVARLSGFDAFFGPEEFKDYIRLNKGECEYLLYVRSSEPKGKLRNPRLVVEQPVLSDPELRRIIKAQALTFNIDAPQWPLGSPRRINDTKAYLAAMGMAYPVYIYRDLSSSQLLRYSGQGAVRAKPMLGSYGGYGHIRGDIADGKFKRRLRQNLRDRGPYVVQPEMDNVVVANETDGSEYAYIDRNYFSFVDGQPQFIGGERTLMLTGSKEVTRGRIHGNESSVTAEII